MSKKTFLLSIVFWIGAPHTLSADVIKDERNAIYWQDTAESEYTSEDWDDAVEYCDSLKLHGMTNWRLPTFEELLSITDYTRHKPAILPVFTHVNNDSYWTSTDFSANRSRAWTIDFSTGYTYNNYKRTNHAVRCVSDLKEQK